MRTGSFSAVAALAAGCALIPSGASAAAYSSPAGLTRAAPSPGVEVIQYRTYCRSVPRRVCGYNPYQPGVYRCRIVYTRVCYRR